MLIISWWEALETIGTEPLLVWGRVVEGRQLELRCFCCAELHSSPGEWILAVASITDSSMSAVLLCSQSCSPIQPLGELFLTSFTLFSCKWGLFQFPNLSKISDFHKSILVLHVSYESWTKKLELKGITGMQPSTLLHHRSLSHHFSYFRSFLEFQVSLDAEKLVADCELESVLKLISGGFCRIE